MCASNYGHSLPSLEGSDRFISRTSANAPANLEGSRTRGSAALTYTRTRETVEVRIEMDRQDCLDIDERLARWKRESGRGRERKGFQYQCYQVTRSGHHLVHSFWGQRQRDTFTWHISKETNPLKLLNAQLLPVITCPPCEFWAVVTCDSLVLPPAQQICPFPVGPYESCLSNAPQKALRLSSCPKLPLNLTRYLRGYTRHYFTYAASWPS